MMDRHTKHRNISDYLIEIYNVLEACEIVPRGYNINIYSTSPVFCLTAGPCHSIPPFPLISMLHSSLLLNTDYYDECYA